MADWPEIGPGLNEFGGDWDDFEDDCYKSYFGDFYTTSPTWPENGVDFRMKRHPEYQGKCATFWHIASEGSDEQNRMISIERLERIEWPRQIIDEFAAIYPAPGSERIVWWKNKRKGERRILVALADFSYVVVLSERNGYVLLWTAYPVEHSHTQRRLEREYEAYWAGTRF